jgi:hypothetical protein
MAGSTASVTVAFWGSALAEGLGGHQHNQVLLGAREFADDHP